MKFRISVSKEKYDQIKDYLTKMGIETGDDAEYVISENHYSGNFIPARNDKKERINISSDDVIYIESFGDDIEIHTGEGLFYARDRMYKLEESLDKTSFIRISKSVIISRKHIKKIRPTLSMKYILTMTDGSLVDVTRSHYASFRSFMNI